MDLLKAMGPFIKISQVCGLFPYNLKKTEHACYLKESGKILWYSKIFFILLTLAEGGTFITSDFSLRFAHDISAKFILLLSAATLYISFTMIFRSVMKKRKILCFWLNQLNNLAVNIGCRRKSCCKSIRSFNRRLLYFTSAYYFAIIATRYTTCDGLSWREIGSETVFFVRLWVIHLFLKQFVIFTNYVRYFYLRVQKILIKNQTETLPETAWVKELRDLRSKDLFMKDFVEVLNSIYMPVILVQLMWFFVTLLCDITITRQAGLPTLIQVEWMVYICLETVLYATVCHKAAEEARKTFQHLQDPFVAFYSTGLQFEVELCSLQVQHRKLNFNVFGFFSLDFTLLYSMIGATTTYTVILLQFQNINTTKIYAASPANFSQSSAASE